MIIHNNIKMEDVVMYDVSVIGDIVMDFTPVSMSKGHLAYETNVGGTATNLAATVSKFGMNTLFTGKAGNDFMGKDGLNLLKDLGVDVSGYIIEDGQFTTHAFVTLKEGERSFALIRKGAADEDLKLQDVNIEQILDTKMIYVTGMGFTRDPIRETSFTLLKEAQKRGIFTAIDVNYRESLWDSQVGFINQIREVIPYLDLYKSTDEEALIITGESTLTQAAEKISALGPKLVVLSCGEKGAYYYYQGIQGHLNAYDIEAVDTTGAGDCFMGALLYKLHEKELEMDFHEEELDGIIDFCNAAGGLSINKRGGVTGIPSRGEVIRCQNTMPKKENLLNAI